MSRARRIMGVKRGQSAIEFVMVLPFVAFFVLSTIWISAVCIRGGLIEFAAERTARVAKVYQDDLARAELYASLTPDIADGTTVEWRNETNWTEGIVRLVGEMRGSVGLNGVTIERRAETTSALVPGLTDRILRGGDAITPYCRGGKGYIVCGYER